MVLRQLTKEQAKEEVKKLVAKYNRIVESGSIKRYKEEDTKAEFIEPLFEALGWDVRNTENDDEVVREEKISKGRVDYSFRINGIPKFFLEAKALKEDLDNIKFVEQAINYAWHKGCTWAVLTDFEAIKIFNAEWKSTNPLQAQFGQTLPCQLFLEKFDQLWLLSRESFEKKLLDTEAEKWGKKVKKISVDKQLLDDLTKFRDLLNKNILKNNSSKNLSGDELDEAVQRIIDRLIFIRTLEDKELEAPMLQSVIREDLNKKIYKKLNLIFRKIDDIYDSKLFTLHLCDNLEIDDEVLSKIINGLFNTSDNTVHYDFSAIDADVLGNIYEQYLGHILKKTDKRAKLAEGKAHRKEQGIYYTPTYVVDYIVKNTVGELAKDKKFDLNNIKILDPACGSGSFLMKAFDYLVTLDKKKNGEVEQTKLDLAGATASYGRKVEILKNNIFGVDLDPKAVEIAQLNLLLKAAEKKHRLPTLQENIKVGNSLIDDKNISPRAFKWEEEFKEIIDNGGFDVVIGNPPYVNVYLMNEKERKFFDETSTYKTPHLKYDLYTLFIEKGIKLLLNKGFLGLIIPYSVLTQPYAELLRKYILDNCCIMSIVDLSSYFVFQEASVKTIILIFKKENNKMIRDKNKINIIRQNFFTGTIDSKDSYSLDQSYFLSTHQYMFRLDINRQTLSISGKMDSLSFSLGSVCYISKGIVAYSKADNRTKDDFLHDKKINSKCVPYLEGKDVEKYTIHYKGLYLEYNPIIMSRPTFPELHGKNKILVRAMSNSLLATFDDRGFYADQKLICCPKRTVIEKYIKASKKPKIPLVDNADNYNEKYIVGLLNSSLMWYYYKSLIFGGLSIHPEDIRNLPIRRINFSNLEQLKMHNSLVSLVDKMLTLKLNLNKIGDKQTDQKAQLEKEIQKLDDEIDEEVYKLYGITEEEKKIIEESLK